MTEEQSEKLDALCAFHKMFDEYVAIGMPPDKDTVVAKVLSKNHATKYYIMPNGTIAKEISNKENQ